MNKHTNVNDAWVVLVHADDGDTGTVGPFASSDDAAAEAAAIAADVAARSGRIATDTTELYDGQPSWLVASYTDPDNDDGSQAMCLEVQPMGYARFTGKRPNLSTPALKHVTVRWEDGTTAVVGSGSTDDETTEVARAWIRDELLERVHLGFGWSLKKHDPWDAWAIWDEFTVDISDS